MAQITDLNVSPYYDDFDENDNFHRVLFRPGYSIQARELTTLQSILQGQIEQHGKHVFKEGTVVIPGQLSYSKDFTTLQLATTFASEDIVAASFYNATDPVIITGVISGVKAKVIGYSEATTSAQPILHLQYIQAGSDNATLAFSNSENITATSIITHTTSYAANVASATTFTTTAAQTGSSVTIEEGVYFIRGHFVKCLKETLVLSINSFIESGRVGFNITESLVTPETDTTLTDNATGSNNYAAKGAHRLKIALNLVLLDTDSTADSSFVELMRLDTGAMVSEARHTEYSVLGETLARRTFDESGDYTVRNFLYEPKESVTNLYRGETNSGAYAVGSLTDDGNTASESLLTFSIKPGKAYVQGFEIEKLGTTLKDINKSRDFNTINAGVTTFDVGNFAYITNLYGSPDITSISGETTPYKEIRIYTDFQGTTRGSIRGYQIGVARARSIEYYSGTQGSTESIYKVFLFDVRMLTYINLSGTPSPSLVSLHTTGGVQVKGVNSGATGLIYTGQYHGARIALTNVVGTFQKGEKIIASDSAETGKIVEDSDNTDLTIADAVGSHNAIVTHEFREARSIHTLGGNSGIAFISDLILATVDEAGNMLLDGTNAGSADINDKVVEDDGSTRVTLETQKVALLINPEKNTSLFKLPKSVIKTLLTATNSGTTDTQYTVRRQFVGTTNSSGAVTFAAGTNETFSSFATRDYTLSVMTAGGGTAVEGDIILLTDNKLTGEGSPSLTITDSTLLGSAAKVKLYATILKTNVTAKAKSTKLSKQLRVLASDADGAYGVRATDVDISLGRADVYRIQSILDSEDTSAEATAPILTLTTTTGTFVRGERITGGTSNARGRTISTSTPLSYTLIDGITGADFSVGETITGAHSGATAVVSVVTVGSKNITNRFTLDTGQRDNFYDIARLVRKPGASIPLGRLLIIYDYLEHGAGDVFTIDSYTSLNGQMEYDDIPVYSSTRVDPDDPEPSGLFELRDSYDFRPTAEDIAGASATLSEIDLITGTSFNFENRQFDGAGATTVDTPQPGSTIQSDFEFYLPKFATLFLTKEGDFKIIEGVSSEEPQPPKDLDSSLKLASIFIPAYTFQPKELIIDRFKTQRFTMRDIGRLQERIENVEYYTSLSLLEKDAASFEVIDNETGLNRFKSGFVVDNFTGHRVGDALNKDYKIAVDQSSQELRPKCVMTNVGLEVGTTGYTKNSVGIRNNLFGDGGLAQTGDLITLNYFDEVMSRQPYATRVENIQPYLMAGFVGKIVLTPSGDEWFETAKAPALVINKEGDFDTFAANNANAIGTIWNSWETQWSGVTTINLGNRRSRYGEFGHGYHNVRRTIDIVTTGQKRTGTQTSVGSQINEESLGSKVISQGIIPFVRPRLISFTGTCFAPNARLYVFFDRVDVSSYVTPSSSLHTTDTTIIAGSPLITDAAGGVAAQFQIPDYRGKELGTVPFFRTGEVEFRLTSSSTNARSVTAGNSIRAFTAGQVVYFAKGILETTQETIISTRQPILVQTNVDQETIMTAAAAAINETVTNFMHDPLAQTFMVTDDGGSFITKVDFFFGAKDENLPVWCEIRNVVNGYPGPKVLPFGRKVLNPSDVILDETGKSATTFTFDSPVFLQSGTEYCVVLMTTSIDYRVWIAQMGEQDVGGTDRVISKQPHLGVLFKSQNNTTWNAIQMQDLKFTLYRANFSAAGSYRGPGNPLSGVLQLENKKIGDLVYAENGGGEIYGKLLDANPLQMIHNTTALKIAHNNHGMYSTANNVQITGVKSGITTTLNGAITAGATSLTLTSATNFAASNLSSRCYVKIDNEIMYGTLSGTTISSLTRGTSITTSGASAAHANGATVELYSIQGTPLDQINKTHNAIANIDTNSYTITLSTAPTITGFDATPTTQVGGIIVYATENYRFETIRNIIGAVELPDTSLSATLKTTSGTSPSGTESSFTFDSTGDIVPINENFDFDTTRIIASDINESNEISGAKSLNMNITFTSTRNNLSPIIDLDRMSVVAVGNIIDKIVTSSDVYPTTDYIPSTSAIGDNHSAIYITKKVALQNPATALKVLFTANRQASTDIKVMFKILESASADDFDDLGYQFFNTDGSPDAAAAVSLTKGDFQEYIYTAGVTDDGIGTPLPDYIQFAIKIVFQSTNAAQVPRVKDLRAIALAY